MVADGVLGARAADEPGDPCGTSGLDDGAPATLVRLRLAACARQRAPRAVAQAGLRGAQPAAQQRRQRRVMRHVLAAVLVVQGRQELVHRRQGPARGYVEALHQPALLLPVLLATTAACNAQFTSII